jgi:hypothetical protein
MSEPAPPSTDVAGTRIALLVVAVHARMRRDMVFGRVFACREANPVVVRRHVAGIPPPPRHLRNRPSLPAAT